MNEVLCHLCNGKMILEHTIYKCLRCSHKAEMIPPVSDGVKLFNDELEYKHSISKHGSRASQGKQSKPRPKRGIPWYDIDRISAEGSPGQGFK